MAGSICAQTMPDSERVQRRMAQAQYFAERIHVTGAEVVQMVVIDEEMGEEILRKLREEYGTK
jgi:hypothetical protein